MGCYDKKAASFSGTMLKIATRIRKEMIELFPKCPECGGILDMCELNTRPNNQTFDQDDKMLLYCPIEMDCGYSFSYKKTMEQFANDIGFNGFLLDVFRFVIEEEGKRVKSRLKKCRGSKEKKNGSRRHRSKHSGRSVNIRGHYKGL
jgi:hypothetical protein